MRILKLRLCNLNSLSGAWEIDFSHPEYVNEGLFAITGATGAGKTTILDAICLALYGQTPRLGRITKSDNDIMSRQHGDCWAEVCFATEQGEYRAKWYQHRARRSADGALQQAQHILSELESGTIIEESLSGVPAHIEALSGLNFDRFMRSMMLAQGQFAAFLNAKESERSELLEQLTGTDIYAHISKRVFARSKAEKDKLTNLKGRVGDIHLLSEEESQQLAANISSKQKVVDQLVAEKQQKQTLQEWVAKLAKAREEARQLTAQQQELKQAQQDFANQQARLDEDKKVRPFASDLKQYDYFVQQQQGHQQQQQLLKPKLEAVLAKLEQGKQQLDAAQQANEQQQAAWTGIQDTLELARQADVEIGLAERDHSAAQAESSRLQNEHSTLSASQQQHQQQQSGAQKELEQINQWLAAHAEHAQIAAQLALIHRDQDTVSQLDASIAQQRALRDTLRKEYKAMAAMPLAEAQQSAVAASLQNMTTLQTDLKSAQCAVEQHRLQQRFEAQRNELTEGQACPLCGSTEHPFTANEGDQQGSQNEQSPAQAEETVSQLTATLDKANEELHALKVQQAIGSADQQRKLDELKQQGEQCNRDVQIAEDDQQKIVDHWLRQLTTWHVACDIQHDHAAQQQLKQIAQVLEQASAEYQRQQSQQQSLQQQRDQSQQALEHLDAQFAGLQTRIAETRSLAVTASDALQQAKKARAQYFAGRPVREVEQQQQLALKNAAEQLQQIQQNNQRLNEQRVELESENRHLDKALTEVKVALEKTLGRLQEALDTLGITDIESLAQRLLEDDEQQKLAEHADSLQARAQKLDITQQRNQNEIDIASSEQPADPVLNKQRLQAVDHELSLAQRDIGRLDEQQRQDLQARERYQQMLEQITVQQAVYDNWATLDGMIGSADGKKYRNFAQGLTFEIMIDHANQKLKKMSDRYLLMRDAEAPLALNVTDDYQGGEVRSTRNLSGGESFIVSLALALGLAQMASSRVRVDSLFLDEGFGTLDPDTLDIALDTLASLRQEGKMIGLISHVGALKERIPTQLQVDAGAAGRSKLQGPGVQELQLE
ncbi:MAG: AAA family ATPase [Idiomarina sp.]|nr:AAA family ATPase [Idiomarina sp.]